MSTTDDEQLNNGATDGQQPAAGQPASDAGTAQAAGGTTGDAGAGTSAGDVGAAGAGSDGQPAQGAVGSPADANAGSGTGAGAADAGTAQAAGDQSAGAGQSAPVVDNGNAQPATGSDSQQSGGAGQSGDAVTGTGADNANQAGSTGGAADAGTGAAVPTADNSAGAAADANAAAAGDAAAGAAGAGADAGAGSSAAGADGTQQSNPPVADGGQVSGDGQSDAGAAQGQVTPDTNDPLYIGRYDSQDAFASMVNPKNFVTGSWALVLIDGTYQKVLASTLEQDAGEAGNAGTQAANGAATDPAASGTPAAPIGDAGNQATDGSSSSDAATGSVVVQPSGDAIPAGPGDDGRQLTDVSVNQAVWALVKDASDIGKTVVEGVYQYIANMRPNMPVTPEDGARQQVNLFRNLSTLFNRVEGDFSLVFPAVLKLFEHHSDGVFAETHRFRFMDQAHQLGSKDRTAFHNMVHMLSSLAAPSDRQSMLKQIDMTKAMEHGFSEAARNRVRTFFRL